MCCCKEHHVNGTPGLYSWDGNRFSTRDAEPPDIGKDDDLLRDEPGRCIKGLDSHSHHLRLVKQRYGGHALLVRHGGGTERHPLGHGSERIAGVLATLDSDACYLFMLQMVGLLRDAADRARNETATRYAQAFVDKRLKTRRRQGRISVDILPPAPPAAH